MLEEAWTKSRDLHRMFVEAPATGEPPLIARIAGVVVIVERSNWGAKKIVQAMGLIGLCAGAVTAVAAAMALRGGK